MRVPLAFALAATLGCAVHGNPAFTPCHEAGFPRPETINQIQGMRNTDVYWHGSFVGIWPEIRDENLRRLTQSHEQIDGLLLAALLDRDRFAVAHVLLSMRHRTVLDSRGGDDQWGGLRVDDVGGGQERYGRNNLQELHRRWSGRLKDDGPTSA